MVIRISPQSSVPLHLHHLGPLTTFPQTSSPELDSIFSTWRRTVFFPSHLPPQHTSLIYRKSLQHFLTGEEPMSAKVVTYKPLAHEKPKTETFTLEPLDHFDEPNTRAAFHRVLSLLQEKKDWEVFAHFLNELRLSGRKISRVMVQRIIKKAAHTGHMGMAIELFRRTPLTGLRIEDTQIAMEIMLGAMHRAVAAEWGEGELERAQKNAETALRMMADPNHGPEDVVAGPANEAEVVGVPLALAGARAVKYKGGKDEEGKVKQHAERFAECFQGRRLELDGGSAVEANLFLAHWAPAWFGIHMASRILQGEPGITDALNDIEVSQLDPLLKRAMESAESQDPQAEKRRGVKLYNNLSSMI
ncbi:MAG: hypothetical protein LQ340_003783 [Diploschistes diacapsis]|nr:MAG: hypothetical protein LQ340_003783 [Diploschistes diacapsis]